MRLLKSSLILIVLFYPPLVYAGDEQLPEMLIPVVATAKIAPRHLSGLAAQPVRFNASVLFDLPLQSEVFLTLPQGRRYVVINDRRVEHASGNRSWIGYLKEEGIDFRIVITVGEQGSYGRLLTPEGTYLLEAGTEHEWLVDVNASGLVAPQQQETDAVIPPFAPSPPVEPSVPAESLLLPLRDEPSHIPVGFSPQEAAGANSTVDLMVAYTPGFAARHGANLQTRLDYLIAFTNQVLLDSGVDITVRLVHSRRVSYGDAINASDLVSQLVNGTHPELSPLGSLRNSYGADLVMLLRPFSYPNDVSCGTGYLGWYNGGQYSAKWAYSVVSEGKDINGSQYYCNDTTLPHELGHNMGLKHDRITDADDKYYSAFPYSYGHGSPGRFATVMAYSSSFGNAPKVAKFSNPGLDCNGEPCGIPEYQPNSANNALALNNVRATVAGFRPGADRKCDATVSPQLSAYLPLVSYNGAYYWMDLDYVPQSDGSHWFYVENFRSVTNPSEYGACTVANRTATSLSLPIVYYGGDRYYANLSYYRSSTGDEWFKLQSYGRLTGQ